MEPLSPITLPVRLTAGLIILLISTVVVGTMIYFRNRSTGEDKP